MKLTDEEIEILDNSVAIISKLVGVGIAEQNDLNHYAHMISTIRDRMACNEEKPKESFPDIFKWESYDDGIMITKYIGFDEEEICIPSQIDGKQVRAIGNKAFCKAAHIRTVHIPDSVRYIGKSCFSGCTSLRNVSMPARLNVIAAWAFYETAISSVSLPNSVFYVGEYAFAKTELERIVISNSLYNICRNTFWCCSKLKEVYIPEGILSLEICAFSDCSDLNYVFLPNSLKKIGNEAFCNCNQLKTIDIPPSVKEIGRMVFAMRYTYQPDRRYNPRTRYELFDILIRCVPGSYAQEYARQSNRRLERTEINYDSDCIENCPVFKVYLSKGHNYSIGKMIESEPDGTELKALLQKYGFNYVSIKDDEFLVRCDSADTILSHEAEITSGVLNVMEM